MCVARLLRPICMQALAMNVKAEIRAALGHHRISKFVIKPVQRDYVFEMATIPRKKQWVLKVKYPATFPQLPLGLTGLNHLCALPFRSCLFCNQDQLQHVSFHHVL